MKREVFYIIVYKVTESPSLQSLARTEGEAIKKWEESTGKVWVENQDVRFRVARVVLEERYK